MSILAAEVDEVLSRVEDGGAWLEESLAAEVPMPLLVAAWYAADAQHRAVFARVFRARAEASSVPALEGGLRSESPNLRFEAVRALGRIATPRARQAIVAAAEMLGADDPATLMEAGANARVAELEPFAFSRLEADDPVVRWRAARLLAQTGSAEALRAIRATAEDEEDPVWKSYLNNIVEEMGVGSLKLRSSSDRPMVLRSPLFGEVPVIARLGAARTFPSTGASYALWAIRTRYGPLCVGPRLARGDDGLGAVAEALFRVREALDSYEVHRGWLRLSDGQPVTRASLQLDGSDDE